MQKINFQNLPNTTTPVNATNLNQLQTNVENAINGVVASGSTAYGNYVKFDDGTMITYRITDAITVDISTTWGGLYIGTINDEFLFAGQTFLSEPIVLWDAYPTTAVGCFKVCYTNPVISTTRISGLTLARPTSNNNVSVKLRIVAIGKWQ